MGALFSVIAAVNGYVHGGEVYLPRSRATVPLGGVLIAYLLLGPLTGCLFGLVFPWMRSRPRAYLMGVLVSLPIDAAWVAAAGAWEGPKGWFVLSWVALTLGGIGGIMVREFSS
jgi:hypothetical protein